MLPGAWGQYWPEMRIDDQDLKEIFKNSNLEGISSEDVKTLKSLIDMKKDFNLQVNDENDKHQCHIQTNVLAR